MPSRRFLLKHFRRLRSLTEQPKPTYSTSIQPPKRFGHDPHPNTHTRSLFVIDVRVPSQQTRGVHRRKQEYRGTRKRRAKETRYPTCTLSTRTARIDMPGRQHMTEEDSVQVRSHPILPTMLPTTKSSCTIVANAHPNLERADEAQRESQTRAPRISDAPFAFPLLTRLPTPNLPNPPQKKKRRSEKRMS